MKKIIFFLFIIWMGCNIGGNVNVTKENYNKIQNGMNTIRITEMLGKPDSKTEMETEGLGKMEVWHYYSGMTSIMLNFSNGRVISKNWME